MSSSSRALAASASEGAGTDQLWAKAAELERDFAGYKRRLAERRAGDVVPERGGDGDAAAARGRRYEEYVRRRDERLRQEWRARMERKEAEMQELWARLDRTASRGRRGGEELAAASFAREDQVKVQKPGNLVVKTKPAAPVTPRRNNPAAKLPRPRTGVPSSSPATASPRLSTPDPRRRPSHLHREQPHPPATPRKENRRPPPPPTATSPAASSPATPRPRTMLSRSRSLFGDRGCSAAAVGDSPRPPRLQAPRSSYDGLSNLKEPAPAPSPRVAVTRSSSCSSEQAILAGLKKASTVAPEPFYARRPGNGVEPASPPPLVLVVAPRDEPDGSDAAGGGNADRKSNHEYQSSDKVGSVDITGDSDTEPSYVYIKKDASGEQTPRLPPRASAGLGTCPGAGPRPDNDVGGDNGEDTVESTGSNDVVVVAGETPAGDSEEESRSRKESSESLYSNVQSSFSPRSDSELDASATGSPPPSATEQSPDSPRQRKNTESEGAEKSLPIIPKSSGTAASSITVQSPMDAVNGLKRLLTFGKRNGKNSEAPAAPAAGNDGSSVTGGGCPAGGSVKLRLGSSDDLDNSYVITPRVRSFQSFVPSAPANYELKEPVLHAKSPRVHRSFFSLSSFKSRAN